MKKKVEPEKHLKEEILGFIISAILPVVGERGKNK